MGIHWSPAAQAPLHALAKVPPVGATGVALRGGGLGGNVCPRWRHETQDAIASAEAPGGPARGVD
jgi:hypothetical protein